MLRSRFERLFSTTLSCQELKREKEEARRVREEEVGSGRYCLPRHRHAF